MIYDAIMYFDEDLLLDLRLNLLNNFVDKFVIVESKYTHQGQIKKKNFDIKKFSNFENKIIYNFVEEVPSIDSWKNENTHRNNISRSLKNIDDNDYVLISDLDEIPNPIQINEIKKNKFTVFRQKFFYYKLNLINESIPYWYGTKACQYKYLRSPQWLRNSKIKSYSSWRLDKLFLPKFNIIADGGWHFSYLKSPQKIIEKIKSFAHTEFNKNEFLNLNKIKEKICSKEDIFNRGYIYGRVDLNQNNFPKYICDNINKYKDWII